MKRTGMYALLLAMLAATPTTLVAQNKAWATLSGGVLTFTYGPKPQGPTQVTCQGCGKKMSTSSNFCSNCGAKIESDFYIFDALAMEKTHHSSSKGDPCDWCTPIPRWQIGDKYRSLIKKVVFRPSFKHVTNITSTSGWFYMCKNLESIEGIEYLNTSRVESMENMFNQCVKLTSLDLSHFNTASVTNMRGMFSFCIELTSLDLSHFNTASVTDMGSMFNSCKKLTSLDLSHFNTANVTSMESMFEGCTCLTSLNVSSFNTSKVEDMAYMFCYLKSMKTLDISNFDTRKAITGAMFDESTLRTIYVSSEYFRPNNQAHYWNKIHYLRGCNATIIKK